MNALMAIGGWFLVAMVIGAVAAKCITYGTALSPSEQAEQDKEELLRSANRGKYGGFYYSDKS